MTCAQGLLHLLWGGPKLECYGTDCDHHILLIMTGNAHKESCLKLLLILILVREKGLYMLKLIVATKWWLLSQLKKNFLLVSLFSDVALPLSYLYL